MDDRDSRLRDLLMSLGFTAGLLLFFLGFGGPNNGNTARAVVFFGTFLFVGIVPIFGPRIFRKALFAVSALLFAMFGFRFGESVTEWLLNVAFGAGALLTAVCLTPRTQRMLSLLRWFFAAIIVAMCVGAFFTDEKFAALGVLVASPILVFLLFGLLINSRQHFRTPKDDWHRGREFVAEDATPPVQ